MGHEIEKILVERGHEITLRSTTKTPFKAEDLLGSDVAIEFSRPDAVVDNIYKCIVAKCSVVVGTTGWYARLPEVKLEAEKAGIGLLHATNFSIGVNVLFHLNEKLARIMDAIEGYEPGIVEIHHLQKLDKPSGTAITLAEGILDNYSHKKKWVNDITHVDDELTIVSKREGEVPGTHVVNYTSSADHISLVHQAENRSGFAKGAVMAAEWLKGKKGVFTMKDVLKFND